MRITLQEEKTFTAAIGDKMIHGLIKADSWRGMDCLLDANGRDLILNDGAVVKGHPDLLRDLGLVTGRTGFIRVPERKLPNGVIVPEFYVAERKASKADDGKIVIDAARKPWVNISYRDARKVCEANDVKLLTGLQALSLALDIAEQDINWTGGKVDTGSIYQGIHRGNVSGAQDGAYQSTAAEDRRWHELSTGERIYDYSGNAFEWIFDDVHGDADGIVREAFTADSPYLVFPPFGVREKGTGWRPSLPCNWSGYALIRGGFWNSGDRAGVFDLGYGDPGNAYGGVGFRCTL